jgi:hypothetical protein
MLLMRCVILNLFQDLKHQNCIKNNFSYLTSLKSKQNIKTKQTPVSSAAITLSSGNHIKKHLYEQQK